MPLSPPPNTPRARRALLAPALALLALVGAAFVDPGDQRAGAATSPPTETVISLTCEAVDDLVGCTLISARELDPEEGVRFAVSIGGETQTVSATRELDQDGGVRFVVSIDGETQTVGAVSETGPVVSAGSACGEGDGVCYVFAFTPQGFGGGEVRVSEVVTISASAPPPADTPSEGVQPSAAERQPASAEQAEDAGSEPTVAADAEPNQQQIEATDADQAPQLTPAEIARRQREHERRMAEAEQEMQEANAEIRKRQDEGDWPERDPDAPEDELSDAELEAELKVHEELHQQRQAEKEAQRENRFPSHPGDDSDVVVLDFPTEDADGNLPPGAFQEWVGELHELIDAGEPFLVCDHNEVGPDGGALCTWENQ